VRTRWSPVVAALLLVTATTATVAASGPRLDVRPRARLVVSPSSALVDQSIDVRVTGVPRGRKVTLEATTRDAFGKRWRSRLVYRSGRSGVVDTRMKMGLFWSMAPAVKSTTPDPFVPALGDATVRIRALVNGRNVASAVLLRRAEAANVTQHDTTLTSEGFVGTFFSQSPGPPSPAVLMLGGSAGGYGYLPAALIASRGYPTLSLAYFKEPGLPETLKDIPFEYFAKALRWLASEPGVDPKRVIVVGVSRGGEAALLLGATYPDLVHGVIACTTSSDVLSAYPGPGNAWTVGGQPIPNGPIPVERIGGPVLVTGADQDKIWPSALAVENIVKRAHEHGRRDIVGRVYPSAGHGVGCIFPNTPVGSIQTGRKVVVPIGGTRAGNAQARRTSWPLALRFMRTLP
jgi:dienelactone hydrolase